MSFDAVLAGEKRWHVAQGDCRELLRSLPDCSVDAVICDPPYDLTSGGGTSGGGFMQMRWDGTGVAFQVETWREVFRVMNPGAHLAAFGGGRTHHRMMCAIEDAGFEVREFLCMAFGSGMPKALNVSKALDEHHGAERDVVGTQVLRGRAAQSIEEKGGTYAAGIAPSKGAVKTIELTAPASDDAKKWDGWFSGLKPALEPIALFRKPLIGTIVQNVLAHGVGALNANACRVAFQGDADREETETKNDHDRFDSGPRENKILGEDKRDRPSYTAALGRFPPTLLLQHTPDCERAGTRKVASGVAVRHAGVTNKVAYGGNIGRLPEGTPDMTYGGADGLEEVAAWRCSEGCPVAALDRQSGERPSTLTGHAQPGVRHANPSDNDGKSWFGAGASAVYADTGGASRFFPQLEWDIEIDEPFCYTAKASRAERNLGAERLLWVRDSESPVGWRRVDMSEFNAAPETERFAGCIHTTVKPVAVMAWLCKLLCPPGGVILDPFTGSGTTGVAAMPLGFRFIGCELNEPYVEIATARIAKAANRGVQKSLFDLM